MDMRWARHVVVRGEPWSGTRHRAGAHIRPCRSASMPDVLPIRTGFACDPRGEYEPHSGDAGEALKRPTTC